MFQDFDNLFARLRGILEKHSATLMVKEDSAGCYSLHGAVGPAALKAWGGKLKSQTMPVAWVQIGKAYVSYHLMGIYGNAKLQDCMSKELKARMQGKSCYNFKTTDETLFKELDDLTTRSIAGFRKAGFIV
jgi:hypothetical protein